MTEEPEQTGAAECTDCEDLPADFDVTAGGTCYSAKNCGGKVLNNRDAHNCKNSGGKSWRSPDGTCYNL